jgi:hypothetical protein
MRKAIRLIVKLRVEGEAEPAEDFAKLTTQAVRDLLAAGRKRRPPLQITVRDITEDTSYEESETAVS